MGETKFKEIFNRIIKIAEDKGITIGKTKEARATQIIEISYSQYYRTVIEEGKESLLTR